MSSSEILAAVHSSFRNIKGFIMILVFTAMVVITFYDFFGIFDYLKHSVVVEKRW